MKWHSQSIAVILSMIVFVAPCLAENIAAQDKAAIYRLVLLRLVGPDNTFQGQLHPARIYISEMLFIGGSAKKVIHFDDIYYNAHPVLPPPPPPSLDELYGNGTVTPISTDVKEFLTRDLHSMAHNIIWVKNEQSTPIKSQECGNEGGPILITFSTLQKLYHDNIFVQGSLRCGPLFGIMSYLVARNKGGWHIVRVMQGPIS